MLSSQVKTTKTNAIYVHPSSEQLAKIEDKIFAFENATGVSGGSIQKRAWAVYCGLCYMWQVESEAREGAVENFNNLLQDTRRWANHELKGGEKLSCGVFDKMDKFYPDGRDFPSLTKVLENAGATFCAGKRSKKVTSYVCLRVALTYHEQLNDTESLRITQSTKPIFQLR